MVIMEENILISAIVRFCFDYDEVIDDEIRAKVKSKLESAEFIENLIITIHTKAKNGRNIDFKLVKLMLLELERRRLNIEYPDGLV